MVTWSHRPEGEDEGKGVGAADLSQFECFQRVFRALNGDAIEETVVTKVKEEDWIVYMFIFNHLFTPSPLCLQGGLKGFLPQAPSARVALRVLDPANLRGIEVMLINNPSVDVLWIANSRTHPGLYSHHTSHQ